jgi:hypothetical protein
MGKVWLLSIWLLLWMPVASVASGHRDAVLSSLGEGEESDQWIRDNLDFAVKQYMDLAQRVLAKGRAFPRSLRDDGDLLLVPASDWTSGFFPGVLWYFYEYSKDSQLRDLALHFTKIVGDQSTNSSTHDLGFIIHLEKPRPQKNTRCSHRAGMKAESFSALLQFNQGYLDFEYSA